MVRERPETSSLAVARLVKESKAGTVVVAAAALKVIERSVMAVATLVKAVAKSKVSDN